MTCCITSRSQTCLRAMRRTSPPHPHSLKIHSSALICTHLHSSGVHHSNGGTPSVLVQGTDGNFYGTAAVGGPNNGGTVFKIPPGGTLTTLYSFCSEPNCADGSFRYALRASVRSPGFAAVTAISLAGRAFGDRWSSGGPAEERHGIPPSQMRQCFLKP